MWKNLIKNAVFIRVPTSMSITQLTVSNFRKQKVQIYWLKNLAFIYMRTKYVQVIYNVYGLLYFSREAIFEWRTIVSMYRSNKYTGCFTTS